MQSIKASSLRPSKRKRKTNICEYEKNRCEVNRSRSWQHFGSIFAQLLQANRASRRGTTAAAHLELPCRFVSRFGFRTSGFNDTHPTSISISTGCEHEKHHCAWTDQCPICPQSAASVKEQGGFGSTTSRYTCTRF